MATTTNAKPCGRCGKTERTGSGACGPCARARAKQWACENQERIKKYRAENKDAQKARDAKRLAASPEYFSEKSRRWREANRDKVLEKGRNWHKINPEANKKRCKEWAAKNKSTKAQIDRAWHKNNPEAVRANRQLRRARVKGAHGRYSGKDVSRILCAQKGRCAVCRVLVGRIYDVDHIMPLKLGGSNVADNIQILCPPCNRSKSAKTPIEFMQSRGFLL